MSEKSNKSDDAPKGCVVSEEEMSFYKKLFPTFDIITKRKIHCTVCRGHLGCAPGKEDEIKMHPVLRVMQCTDCHEFYSSGEFSRGEDGSELYCRWCGQGGQVYCCSSCPYVFCKSCIVENLNKGVVRDIEENDSWNCFSCSSKIIWPLRAMHWALTKYIAKEKEAITNGNHSSTEIQELLAQDNSTCCKTRTTLNKSATSVVATTQKRRATQSPQTAQQPVKKTRSNIPTPKVLSAASVIASTNNHSLENTAPPPLVMQSHQMSAIPMNKPTTQQYRIPPGIKTTVRSGTPMTSRPTTLNRSATTVQSRMPTPRPTTSGTSLGGGATTIRLSNNQMVPTQGSIPRRQISTITATTTNTSGPVYHTINGYRIDLNSASKQDNFRLPNGKLIQVKRQVPIINQGGTQNSVSQAPPPTSTIMTASTPTFSNMNQYMRPAIRSSQANSQQQHIIIHRPPQPTQQAQAATQQYIIHTPSLQHHQSTLSQQQQQQPPQTIQYRQIPHLQPTTAPLPPQAPIPPGVVGQQNIALKSIPTFVKHIFSSTPLGVARNTLQSQLFHTMEICHHLMTKTHTLTNSNAYKTVHNLMDIKELYIHLSYLLTYAIGRFKGLQEKCLNDMISLGFPQEAKNLEKGQLAKDNLTNQADDDLAIVEPQRDTIELDSDVEDDIPKIKIEKQDKQAVDSSVDPNNLDMPTSFGYGTSDEEIDLNVAADLLAGMLEVELTEGDPSELRPPVTKAKLPRTKTTKRKQRPNSPTTQAERAKIKAIQSIKDTDPKLKMDCKVVVEKLKAPLIEKQEEKEELTEKEVISEKEKITEKEVETVKEKEGVKKATEKAAPEATETTNKEKDIDVDNEATKTANKEKVIEVDCTGDDKTDKQETKKDPPSDDSDKMSIIDLDDDEDDKNEEKSPEKSTALTTPKPVESEVINLDDDDDNVEKDKASESGEKDQSAEIINLDDDDDKEPEQIVKESEQSGNKKSSDSESTKEKDGIEEMEVDVQVDALTVDEKKNSCENKLNDKDNPSSAMETSSKPASEKTDDVFEISEDEDEGVAIKETVDKEKPMETSTTDSVELSKESESDISDNKKEVDVEENEGTSSEDKNTIEMETPSKSVSEKTDDVFEISEDEDEGVPKETVDKEKPMETSTTDSVDLSKESESDISDNKKEVNVEENESTFSENKNTADISIESTTDNVELSKESESDISDNKKEIDVEETEGISSENKNTVELSSEKDTDGNDEGEEIEISHENEGNNPDDIKEIEVESSHEGEINNTDDIKKDTEEIIPIENEIDVKIDEAAEEESSVQEVAIEDKKVENADVETSVSMEVDHEKDKTIDSTDEVYFSPIKATEDSNGKVYVDGKPLEDKDFESSSSSSEDEEDNTPDDIEMKDVESKESQSNGFNSENNSSNYELIESMIKENLNVPSTDKNKIEDSNNGILPATTANEV